MKRIQRVSDFSEKIQKANKDLYKKLKANGYLKINSLTNEITIHPFKGQLI